MTVGTKVSLKWVIIGLDNSVSPARSMHYGSCRVSDQGTTLRVSDLHNARATTLNPFNKPLPEPILAQLSDACIRYQVSIIWFGPKDKLPFKSLRPSNACMGQRSKSSLFQIMDRCLFGAKPLSAIMLTYFQLHPQEHIWMIFYLNFRYFHSGKCIRKCRLQNGAHIVAASMC